jgi:hypothetical protein
MHVQSDTMVAAVHRMLQCAAMASVAQFRIRILVRETGMRPDALVLSILSPEEDVTETKVLGNGRNFISTSGGSVEDSSDDEDDGSGLEDSSCDILTVSVLQGSQVAPGLSMSLRIRPRFKRLHTYIHAIGYAPRLHQPDSRRSAAALPQRVPQSNPPTHFN